MNLTLKSRKFKSFERQHNINGIHNLGLPCALEK